MRQRISNLKKRKARIKRDKSLRNKYWRRNKVLEMKTSKSPQRKKREIFKLPNGKKISWLRFEILKIQSNLAVVIRKREYASVIQVIKNILRNKYAQYWATYRTIASKGSRSLGISDKKRPRTQKEYENIRNQIWQIIKKPETYKASPLKRIWLPKPNSEEFRPISVPSYVDRALQHLYLIVLDVIQEEFSEKDSYGFRSFRSPGWAAKAVTLAIWQRKGFGAPKFAIELDICKCFDSISQEFIIELMTKYKLGEINIEIIPVNIIKNWLNSGYIDIKGKLSPKDVLVPTQPGIPQGGPISPTIINMVLNGIQDIIENIPTFKPDEEFKKKVWVKPSDKISWRYNDKEVLLTEGLDFKNYNLVGKKLRELGYEDVPKGMARCFLTGIWPHSRGPWSYKVLNKDSLMEQSKKLLNDSWIKLFRFANDCIILLNNEEIIQETIETADNFIRLRGLSLNLKKVRIRNLHKGEKFQFVGFEFAIIKNHNKWKVYNYPPASKVRKVKEKVDLLFKKYKYRPYLAYYMTNAVLRGWCNFYATGNSSDAIQSLTYWLWKRTFKYWWEYYKYRNKYRITSQRQKKKLLAYDILKQCQYPLPNTSNRRKILKWWVVPRELSLNNRWKEHSNIYYLIYPKDIKVATPSIITGKSAYYPDDRLELEQKSIYWKGGLIKDLLIKGKGKCKLCQCSLLDENEDEIEIHHMQPFEYGGKAGFTNLAALCKECHLLVTNAVKSKNLEAIYELEANKILKNVSDLIATKVVTLGETPDQDKIS